MMKSFFKKLAFVMALAMVVSTAAPAAQSAAAATEFTYAYQNAGAVEELYMKAGDEVDLCFKGVKDYKNYTLQWKSANPLVATVDKNGVVKAVENGTTTIELVVGDGSVYTSTPIKVVVGGEIKVDLGVSAEDTFTTKTLEVGTSVDLDFFGVPNYSETNYSYTWISNAPEVVKVDQKGVCVAVASGSATVTVAIVNNVTGDTLTVAPVVITVPTPVVELTYEVKQISDTQAKLVFNDTVTFTKNDVSLEIVYDGGFTATWPIKEFKCADNEITFSPYVPFQDGDKFLIKVGAEDEGTVFETKIGAVDQIVVTYKTVELGDMGKNKAYTNGEDGAELTVQMSAKLYSQGVDVSKVYSAADVVYTLSQENEFAMIDEYAGTIVFSKAGVPVTVIANYVYYDENDNEKKVPTVIEMTSEMAPAYTVTGVKAWTIASAKQLSGDEKIDWSKPVHDIAAYQTGSGIVALITDNYGNTVCTSSTAKHTDNKIVAFGSSRFATEGYYVTYASANVEKLLVGPNGDLTTYVTTNVPVIFELKNSNLETDSKLVRNIYAGTVTVKDAVRLDKIVVSTGSLTLVTDGDYTTDKFKVTLKDQYGNAWKQAESLKVEYSVEGTSIPVLNTAINADGDGEEFTVDGSEIICSKSSVKVTFKHEATGKVATLNINLKDPKYTDATETKIKVTSYQLAATGANQTVDKQDNYKGNVAAEINYYTLSNGYKVGNVSEVTVTEKVAGVDTLVEKEIQLAASANDLKLTTKDVVKGEQFVVVYDPSGNIVGTAADVTKAYVEEVKPGQYKVIVADDIDGQMKYAPVGTYTVKVLQVSSFNKKDEAVFSTKYSANFKVENNNAKVEFAKQNDLDVTDNVDENGNPDVPTTLGDIIKAAIAFNRGGAGWSKFKGAMVDVTETAKLVVENEASNYIVITDVVINVPLNGDGDTIYYTVKVPVNKAVKVSDAYFAN